MKKLFSKMLSKAEGFLWYIAKGDKALTEELERIGPKGVIAISVTISVACCLVLVLWVV